MRVCICISIRKRTVLLLVSTTGGNSETSSKLIKPRNPYTPKHGYHCSSIIILESLRTYLSLSLSRWYDLSSLFLWSLSPGPCLHCSGLTASVCSQKKRWSSLEKGLSLLWTTWMSLLCNIASIGFQTHGFEMESGFGVENPFQLESRWIEIY